MLINHTVPCTAHRTMQGLINVQFTEKETYPLNTPHISVKIRNASGNLYVLLTVRLSISLDKEKLDAYLLYFTIRPYNPLHVSSITCSSSGG